MKTSLRTTSVVLFFIGVALIILKMADSTWIFTDATVNHQSSDRATSNLISLKVDSQSSKRKTTNVQSSSDYEPPNYGGPDSPSYGSGTR
ncbi:hypothetical protein [Fischerella sp. JS2]|uniref:hypothetical protein n=1 Tax=Fischerella sp. JS2 TaxID=2597771 RepID=UPI0028E94EAA|nr:hypothetical protein [Fischerella sp. JS2]